MGREEKLKGVDGWLLIFIITLIIITPLSILYYISQDNFFIDGQYDFGSALTGICFSIWAIAVGVALWRKKTQAIIRAKEFLVVYLVFVVVFMALEIMFTQEPISGDMVIERIGRDILYFIIWFSYLNTSKRVKNTFEKRELNIKRLVIIVLITLVTIFMLIFLLSPYSVSLEYFLH